jgi:hypothetical protein
MYKFISIVKKVIDSKNLEKAGKHQIRIFQQKIFILSQKSNSRNLSCNQISTSKFNFKKYKIKN